MTEKRDIGKEATKAGNKEGLINTACLWRVRPHSPYALSRLYLPQHFQFELTPGNLQPQI
jgi:hypothetical protein